LVVAFVEALVVALVVALVAALVVVLEPQSVPLARAEHVRRARDHLIALSGVLDSAIFIVLLCSPHAHVVERLAVSVTPSTVRSGHDKSRARTAASNPFVDVGPL
jgi:hypothetical protein